MLQAIKLFRIRHLEQYVTQNVKNRSRIILRLWMNHCEYIVAQRFRRGQQMICLYRRIWEEQALRELLQRFRRKVQRHTKGLLMSGIGVTGAFDWDMERISYESIRRHIDEIDNMERLRKDTIHCVTCGKRLVIDHRQDDILYCSCARPMSSNAKAATTNAVSMKGGEKPWIPYLERKNMIVWRREEWPGLYAYKVYAVYKDVSAKDFLHVQIDTEYRKEWDKTAVALDVIDSDPVHKGKSQIIYWEMLWPKLFANRDYVFNRRYFVDSSRKLIIIVNKSTQHPNSPRKPNNQRVQDYWSYMVIRSTSNSFKNPGLEYVLTYFDNPGIVLPPTVTSWVAQKQMPDFLNKLYMATVEYAQERKKHQIEIEHSWDNIIQDPGYEYPPDREFFYSYGDQDDLNDDGDRGNGDKCDDNPDSIDDSNDLDANQQKSSSWWSYLIPFHYFA